MRLLCLSNGHGEDTIALQILKALQAKANSPQIDVLPIVGEGQGYVKNNFPVIGMVKAMPSGGFIYMDRQQLANDIKGGLLKLTLEQLKSIRRWGRERKQNPEGAIVLAVGDVVPMFFAWQSGLPYAFIGTAKSEYYLRDESGSLKRSNWWADRLSYATGSVYYPWERWFMSRPNCKAVFPRDRITTETLQKFGIPAYDLGNPMMDLDSTHSLAAPSSNSALTILLLPGSRIPEAYGNWDVILSSVQDVCQNFHRPVHFLAALSPELDRDRLELALSQNGWNLSGETWVIQLGPQPMKLTLAPGQFADCAQRSDVAIAMAGTATEQFVGLGKPALTIAGAGPQFTAAFAEAQTRLLGESILKLDDPTHTTRTLTTLWNDPTQRQRIAENGRRRMGNSGSADRIALKLVEILSHSSVES
jgi:uncharacterized protein (TIGR03492 family)